MIKLPKQLMNEDFRFILLGKWDEYKHNKTKAIKKFYPKTREDLKELKEQGWLPQAKTPIEVGWQTTKNYTYNSKEIINHTGNIGSATGYGGLGVMDDDSKDKRLLKLFKENYGETFQVRKDGHLYIEFEGLDSKIIFYDPVEKDEKGDPLHLGELQWKGQQCVTCPSIHPLGEKYEAYNDTEIIKIKAEDFKRVFDKYIPKPRIIMSSYKQKEGNTSGLNDLKVTDIISTSGFSKVKGGLLGAHPEHGCTNGGNFLISDNGYTWTCFRCNKGKDTHTACGNAWTLIAVMEGIISCENAGPKCLTNEQFKEVLKLAKEKYGVKITEHQERNLSKYEARGYAKHVNIKSIAEKYSFVNCPNCGRAFVFNENLGFFKCKKCNIKGGIVKFTELMIRNKKDLASQLLKNN